MQVAIVFGGYSPEWVISEKSANVVFSHLNSEQYRCTMVHISDNGWHAVMENGDRVAIDRNDFRFEYQGVSVKFDVVFNAIHGTPGEDGRLQGYFDMVGLPYTSPNVLSSALTFNKSVCNGFLRQYPDLHIADSVVLHRHDTFDADAILKRIGLPCFVKPSCAGSSFGISKVKDAAGFAPAIAKAFEHDHEVVIEAFVQGVEVSCGVYRVNGVTTALAGTEIVTENDFFDYQAKYEGASKEITPPRISDEESQLIRETTIKVFDRIGLKGMSRIDFIVKDGKPYLIEVNTIPGLSEASILPQQVRHAGMSLADFFAMLVEEAMK